MRDPQPNENPQKTKRKKKTNKKFLSTKSYNTNTALTIIQSTKEARLTEEVIKDGEVGIHCADGSGWVPFG